MTGAAGVADAVRVEDLWVTYRTRNRFGWRRPGGHDALRGVDLAVAPGRCLGVVGGNGSGKTTLLQALAGVLRPTRGRISITGRVASLVDLSAGFHRDLTGHENVTIGGVLLGLTRREVRERYHDIVAFSGLDADALDWPLSAYSAGMGLRLGFSLVVHAEPDVVLVDEVLAVGDEAFQRQCLTRIRRLQDQGSAIVVVSHDMDVVRERCDEVAVLHEGEVVRRGRPDEAVATYLALGGEARPEPRSQGLFGARGRTAAARRKQGVG